MLQSCSLSPGSCARTAPRSSCSASTPAVSDVLFLDLVGEL